MRASRAQRPGSRCSASEAERCRFAARRASAVGERECVFAHLTFNNSPEGEGRVSKKNKYFETIRNITLAK